MTIAEAKEKCKSLISLIPRDSLILAVMVLASVCSFGLGYMAGADSERGSEIGVDSLATGALEPTVTNLKDVAESGQVVASKNGTKYYLPTCAGAKRISERNKIFFASVALAEKAGYAPAANCNGI